MTRRPFTITLVRRAEDGAWEAHLTVEGRTFHVDRRYGSWQAQDGETRRFVLPAAGAELQARVRAEERKEAAGA